MRRSTECSTRSRRQRGVTSIEYALIAALIALAIVVGVSDTGVAIGKLYDHVATQVADAIKL
jgi:pilus assembly protein Flp/PilA